MTISASLFKRLPYRVRARMKFNVRVKLGNREVTIPTSILEAGQTNLAWANSWKTEVIARLLEGDKGIFVDVGANVGQTLLDLKMIKPHYSYRGFEPNATCVNYLKDLIRLNTLEDCQIFPMGLSDRAMCLTFFRHKDEEVDPAASIVPNLRPGREYDTDIVPCFRFDDVMRDVKLGKIDLMKIDIEGAELEALQGMAMSIREYQPIILCEVLFTDSKGDLATQDQRKAEIMQMLAGLRYKVVRLIKNADATKVIDLQNMESFPSGYWSQQNKELCDYLFFPADKEEKILRAFPSSR